MKTSTTAFLLFQLLVGSLTSALPTDISSPTLDQTTSHLKARAVAMPTIPELRTMIKKQGKIGANAVYWTGGADKMEAGMFALELKPEGGTYTSAISPEDTSKYTTAYANDAAKQKLYNARLSVAISEESKKTVYLMIPDNVSPTEVEKGKPKSVWLEYEFPALQRNTAVDEVIRVSPDYPYKKGAAIWKKGSKATLPEGKC